MKRSGIALSLMIALINPVFAQSEAGAIFLLIAPGARAGGMGEAQVAVADDAYASYWNPAGLSSLKKNEILLDHQDWILDVDLDFVGASFKTPFGTIGAAICAMYMGEMEVTTTHNPEGTGEKFSAGSIMGQLTFSRSLTDRFSFGVTAKVVRESIYNSKANGFALDLGTLYNTQIPGLTMGMSISNYGSKMRYDGIDLINPIDILENENEKFECSFLPSLLT